jgi:hypothetical protein
MQSFPFDSYVTYDSQGNPTYDRAVSSQPLRTIIRKLFTTGVMPNPSTNFQVNAGTDGMTVLVQSGFAVVDGGLCKEDEVRTLSVTAADAIYDRIDTIVLRWNENVDVRTADLYVLAGTPAETPIRPTLQRGSSIYEIGLADVFITHGIATITEDKITDTRYESERCGIVSSVSEWDTTTIYQQIQSELAKFKNNEEVAFANWFESIKDQFDEDAAGHLQNEIDKNTKNISDVNGRLTQVQSQIVPTASIEIGDTASKAYNVDDFLVKDGILYKVTKAIAKDDALTVGDNIELSTVTSELSSISERLSRIPISEYKIKEYTIEYNNTKTWMEYNIEEKNAFLDCSSYIVVEGSSQDDGTIPINYGERSLCYIRYYKDRADTIKMYINYVCTAHVFIRYK